MITRMSKIVVYGTTTCPHCKRTKEFLERNKADFDVVWIDKLDEEAREEAIERIHRLTGMRAVPVVVKGDKWVVGFDEVELRELLKD